MFFRRSVPTLLALTAAGLLSACGGPELDDSAAPEALGAEEQELTAVIALFEHAGYGGAQLSVSRKLGCYNLPVSFDNRTSSVINRLSVTVVAYPAFNCGGGYGRSYAPGATDRDLSRASFPGGGTWNDRISSLRFL